MSDNAITIEGAQDLAAALQCHPLIEILDLRGCLQTSSELEAWERLGTAYTFTNCDEVYDHGVDVWGMQQAASCHAISSMN